MRMKNVKIKEKNYFLLCLLLVAFLIAGCGNNSDESPEVKKVNVESPSSQPTPIRQTVSSTITNPVFDIPSLLGKNIDEVTTLIGPPTRDETERQSDRESSIRYGFSDDEENFERQGVGLLVRYSLSNQTVLQFFLIVHGEDNDDLTTDTGELLRAGNLSVNDSRYRIEFVTAAGMPGQYLGVRVSPIALSPRLLSPEETFGKRARDSNPPRVINKEQAKREAKRNAEQNAIANAPHTVTFRITGTGGSAYVNYYGLRSQRGMPIGTNKVNLPWEYSITSQRGGGFFDLEAQPNSGRDDLTVEILIDQEVAASETMRGSEIGGLPTVQCTAAIP